MSFGDLLAEGVKHKGSSVCVGIDPRWGSLPDPIRKGVDANDLKAIAGATECYAREVIDAVVDATAVVKPQAAFFEQLGPHGMVALANVIGYAREKGLLILLDGKRGDIGSTAEGYAAAYLGQQSPWAADALTVNPYLGDDTLEPFVRTAVSQNAGIFVLVKTSNPGSGFLQDCQIDGLSIFERVATKVQEHAEQSAGSSGYGDVGAVVGATYPDQLASLRQKMPNAWLLIPGYGAQGGTADDVLPGFDADHLGAIVNSSRGIIFAYQKPEFEGKSWQDAVAAAAQQAREQLPSPAQG